MRLRTLEIDYFALIRHASMTFADGLTVCTGETGSGKSMLLDALGFVLGERASPDIVSAGAARSRVTLRFEPDEVAREAFAAEGFALEEDEDALLTREMSAAGKSSARINGRPATTAQLRAWGERVADIVGQHDQQRLLAPKRQLDILDRFAGAAALGARAHVAALHTRSTELLALLEQAGEEAARSAYDYARDAVREIDEAAIRVNEEASLRERRDYLANIERVAGAAALAHEGLTGGERGVVEGLGSAAGALGSVVRFSDKLRNLHDRILALQSDANELAAELSGEAEESEFDPRELEAIGERLDLVERLKRKYGGTLENVLAERERARAVVDHFETRDERQAALRRELDAVSADLLARAAELTRERGEAARLLEERVARALEDLAMPAARFSVALHAADRIGNSGAERAEFLLAPNPGEPLRSLAYAASGGELSRVLLALISAASAEAQSGALIFDEIDAGVGGAAANAVGARLGALARRTQVVCVTHLAQIASWADAHHVMRKRSDEEGTRIELHALEHAPVVREEIARMLSGNAAEVALRHADALLEEACRMKAGEQ